MVLQNWSHPSVVVMLTLADVTLDIDAEITTLN